jgi:4'-phosphopantetheinyl transferase
VQLPSDEVHWWRVGLDVSRETCADLYAMLTPDERSRSGRLRFECDQRRFVVAHGALRDLLARYLKTQPGDISFVTNPFGKPALAPGFDGGLRFSLAHSADLALIAIAADADIGVDVEHIRASPDYADIARHFFSAAEVDDLNRLPQHRYAEAFLTCWTQKEACAKASGDGLAFPPRHGAWSSYTLQPAPGYVGALAIERREWRLRQWHWRS